MTTYENFKFAALACGFENPSVSPRGQVLEAPEQTSAGIENAMFETTFRHRMQGAPGRRLHFVIGGQGDPVLLVPGWPQSWYAWRKVMPALAQRYTGGRRGSARPRLHPGGGAGIPVREARCFPALMTRIRCREQQDRGGA
jgi:hypothetical protein